MTELLSIGDFARATHLSVKALRHYQEQGLLQPTEIDPSSGYRRYALDLLPKAQIIRRLRSLGMPLGEVRSVIVSDIDARNEVIGRHLRRLQHELSTTQEAVAALQDLIEKPGPAGPIVHRSVSATRAAAIVENIDLKNASAWLAGALGELYAVLDDHDIPTIGDAAGIYENELFTLERGTATAYLPVSQDFPAAGRVRVIDIPPAELAVITHGGSHNGIDREYSALAAHVARHELAVDGPVREYYPINRRQTADRDAWQTEIGWPIFMTKLDPPS
jgi:DNA-binding transcriptional MerR regulator